MSTAAVTSIKFTNGRAFRFEVRQLRWFPIKRALAEYQIATGEAQDVTGTELADY